MDMMSYLMGRNSGSAKKGAKIEVVTELPETGEANVIYLVPKQDEDENNVFDEYIWINDDWELIGTTDIDLSGYQPLLTAGSNITIENNVISASGGSDIPIYFVEHDNTITNTSNNNSLKARLTEVVNDAYSKGCHSFNILLEVRMFANSTWRRTTLMTSMGDGVNDLQLKPTSYTLYTPFYGKTGNLNDLHLNGIRINISWDGDVATVTGVSNSSSDGSVAMTNNVLTKTNTTSFIPTQPYHPSTKKYVDDSIANKQDVLTAGSNITIENNVISASGGSSGDAKVYVYKITSGRGIHTTSSISATETNDLQRMGEIITNGYAHGLTGLYFGTTGYDYINFMSLSTNLSEKPTTIYFDGTIFARPNDGGAGSRYIEAYIEVKGTWSDDVFTCSQVKYTKYNTTSNGYVTTWRNTNAITPTSDYNPATKKYVDDSIVAAITTTLGGSF